jgi:hypothetical protein
MLGAQNGREALWPVVYELEEVQFELLHVEWFHYVFYFSKIKNKKPIKNKNEKNHN